jgi:hypothetical protein
MPELSDDSTHWNISSTFKLYPAIASLINKLAHVAQKKEASMVYFEYKGQYYMFHIEGSNIFVFEDNDKNVGEIINENRALLKDNIYIVVKKLNNFKLNTIYLLQMTAIEFLDWIKVERPDFYPLLSQKITQSIYDRIEEMYIIDLDEHGVKTIGRGIFAEGQVELLEAAYYAFMFMWMERFKYVDEEFFRFKAVEKYWFGLNGII